MFKKYIFRKSKLEDKEVIRELIKQRFGIREDWKLFSNIEDRYLLAFDENKLIGMTGLYPKEDTEFRDGYEIDWTCVDKNYEGQGLMTYMFSLILEGVNDNIYCSCWSTEGEGVHLKKIMERFGFVEVINPRISYNNQYNKFCSKENCVYYKDKCKCCEILYIRKLKQY